nr:hypothetical protein BaRGS_023723 [Batillaria attramentaria]
MVLQRGPQHAVLWGTASTEGDTVTAKVTGQGSHIAPVTTQVTNGHWKLKLHAVTQKGPFVITVSSKRLAQSSAVCWLFGQYLYDHLHYPIGLVESSYGGTNIEAWSPPEALHDCSATTKRGPQEDSVLWNAMINPLRSMTMYGAIWYQGESNSGHYAKMAQTANYGYSPNPALPNTFMAVAMDLPDFDSPYGVVHPRYKQDVAERLVLGALNVAYGQNDVTFQGPFPTRFTRNEAQHKLTIEYDHGHTPIEIRSQDGFEVSRNIVRSRDDFKE